MKSYADPDFAARANFKNAKLLVIEDNADHGFMIQNEMRRSMPEVNTVLVTNEDEAVTYLDHCKVNDWDVPKLILLDLYLPDRQGGWRLLDYIRSLPAALGKMPVVLFSYSNDLGDIAEAYQRGCSSYLVKPTLAAEWQPYFNLLRNYWWETVTLPTSRLSIF